MKKYNWSPIKRIDRNKKILEAHNKHLSYRAIAKIFKISQTRVSQIVKSGAADKSG